MPFLLQIVVINSNVANTGINPGHHCILLLYCISVKAKERKYILLVTEAIDDIIDCNIDYQLEGAAVGLQLSSWYYTFRL